MHNDIYNWLNSIKKQLDKYIRMRTEPWNETERMQMQSVNTQYGQLMYSKDYKKRAISSKFCNILYVQQSYFEFNFFLF